jgi:hypothetical protein
MNDPHSQARVPRESLGTSNRRERMAGMTFLSTTALKAGPAGGADRTAGRRQPDVTDHS